MTTFDLTSLISLDNIEKNENKEITIKKFNLNYSDTCTDVLYIMKYNKEYINLSNIKTLGCLRSIITNKTDILCFSPQKSINFEDFDYSDKENIEITEFYEGTMINMFYNSTCKDWEISTKGNIGAKCKFYENQKRTFRALFLEALNEYDILLSTLDTTKCYSFVLQHPENRIVIPFKKIRLILTNIYHIDGFKISNLSIKEIIKIHPEFEKLLPEPLNNIKYESIEDLKNIFNGLNLDYNLMGVVLINNKTGERTKLRNPNYEYVRRLKGNSSRIQFQYYSLRYNGKVKEYLKYYPKDKAQFQILRNDLHNWTIQLWKNYINCFIKKNGILKDYPYQYRPHMWALHQIYFNECISKKEYISKKRVIDYINNLEPPRLMFAINYNLHKRDIDKIKTQF